MYSIIKTVEELDEVTKYINKFGHEYKGYFPKQLVVKLLELIMKKMSSNLEKHGGSNIQEQRLELHVHVPMPPSSLHIRTYFHTP